MIDKNLGCADERGVVVIRPLGLVRSGIVRLRRPVFGGVRVIVVADRGRVRWVRHE